MIRTYDDITTIDRYDISSEDDAREHIRATDLQAEAIEHFQSPDHRGALQYLRASAYNSEGLEVLYAPSAGRGGVAFGADAQWTDADSAEDALERYFGVNGKEMIS